ncbi:hypothetical protein P3T40_003397 [Paraburkholderia sp. EB58]|jgi:hypothetical protein|uniref:hypothetical protein n=1 Tax=Paraburkholderia sp. EB58 TaxID=3035125 RepID=UPI003D231E20
MSFLYPRTIAITRPNNAVQAGYNPSYSGLSPSQETPIASDLPASIQLKKDRGRPDTGLPGDTSAKSQWTILIPRSKAALGTIETWDVITDDLNVRYQVLAPYWNSLGYALLAERLEV